MPRIDSGLPAFTPKIAKDLVHRGHSVEQTGTICSLSEHETSRALGDTVHQDPPAAGRRCTRSSISRCRSSAEACRASIARCLCSATAARRSVAIFPVRVDSAPALRPSAVPWRHLRASGSGCISPFSRSALLDRCTSETSGRSRRSIPTSGSPKMHLELRPTFPD